MVGSGSAAASRSLAVDRFYSPPHVRRHQLELQQQQLAPSPSPSPPPPAAQQQRPVKSKPRTQVPAPPVEVDVRAESEDSKPSVSSSPSPSLSSSCVSAAEEAAAAAVGNLERFLRSTTPAVSAQFLSKTSVRESNLRRWRVDDIVDLHSYFLLGDLWESFKEWSAYGAGVPIVLDGNNIVVQYYVPYLSAIQLYADPSKISTRLRRAGEGSDGDTSVDTSSEGSSESEADRFRSQSSSFETARQVVNGGCFSDEGEDTGHANPLIFEYLERDTPYGREPLSDKLSNLARECAYLKKLRSCDLLPTSWMSIAWYPIYRIPTGPTLKDLDACFLTFYHLATSAANNTIPVPAGTAGFSGINGHLPDKLPLPVFGLALYKFRSSIWVSEGSQDQLLAQMLLQGANDWLRILQVDHPDFRFFTSHFSSSWR